MKSLKSIRTIFLALCMALAIPATGFAEGWSTRITEDEMTGEQSLYVKSDFVASTKPMRSPYDGTVASLNVSGCTSVWMFVSADVALDNATRMDDFNVILTRVKWDDRVEYVHLLQHRDDRAALSFSSTARPIHNIIKSNKVLVEVPWRRQGKVYFEFSLAGAAAEIEKFGCSCADLDPSDMSCLLKES